MIVMMNMCHIESIAYGWYWNSISTFFAVPRNLGLVLFLGGVDMCKAYFAALYKSILLAYMNNP